MIDASPAPPTSEVSHRRRNRFLWSLGLALPVIVVVSIAAYFINVHWPYRYRNVEPLLEGVLTSNLKITHYHRTYFPRPGFVADALTLRRDSAPNLPPIGTTRKLIVQGSWLDLLLLRNRVQLVDIVGLHVVIPPVGSQANHEDFPPGSSSYFAGPSTMVEVFRIHHALLDVMRTNGSRYSYPIELLTIRNLQAGHAISYSVDMRNAVPTGHIIASGSFGPLTPQNLGGTPVSGNFTFTDVNLAGIGDLHGTLTSAGQFSGALEDIEAVATARTTDFAVGAGKPTAISGSLHCAINALNSNLLFHSIDATTGATAIHAQGASGGSPRITDLDLAVARGRTQDLLHPFLHSETPIVGTVWLKAHAHLAPSPSATFIQRLSVNGSFDVPAERITDTATEHTLSAFSHRAQTRNAPPSDPLADPRDLTASADVLSSIQGPVSIRDGVLSSHRLTFRVPGAAADMAGWYNLRNDNVRLTGNLRMEANISHVTTGWKSFLLKPLIPFFAHRNAGAVIPIAITGGPNHYKVSQNILHTK